MYWDLGLLLGTSKKWKVSPIWFSAGNAHFPALDYAETAGNFGVTAVSDYRQKQ